MVEACRKRGMAAGAEVSHFPIPQSLIKSHPEWQQKKLNGKSWKDIRICPNNPEVREYVVALFGDLAANYDLDYIQTCQHLFFGNTNLKKHGTCFCEHCVSEAKEIGFDLEAAIPKLREDEYSQPERKNWFELRKHSTTEFYRLIFEEIARVKQNPKCHLRYNDSYPYRGWILEDLGMHLDEVSPHLGSLVHQDHEEQKGKRDETFARRKAWLTKSRRLIGPDMTLICGVAPRIRATPELVKRGIKVALDHPAKVNGLAFKRYDGASFGLMRAFRQGMIDAGVQGLDPVIGKEVEDMELQNFKRVDDYVEEWGAETNQKRYAWTSSSSFPARIKIVRIRSTDAATIYFGNAGSAGCGLSLGQVQHLFVVDLDRGSNVKVLTDQVGPVNKVLAIDVQFLPGVSRRPVVNRERLPLDLFHVFEQAQHLFFVQVFNARDAGHAVVSPHSIDRFPDIADLHFRMDIDLVDAVRVKAQFAKFFDRMASSAAQV